MARGSVLAIVTVSKAVIRYGNSDVWKCIMPVGDGTGPPRSLRGGRFHGNRAGSGPSGECVCPDCGAKVAHQVATPCDHLSCPKCGQKMMRV